MAENQIELKSVGELLGMKFFIPNYQRGYRWTEQQVKDLLNDIDEFRLKISSDDKTEKDDFYCLQPLVVKECINDKEGFLKQLPKEGYNNSDVLEMTRKAITDNTKWEVIDGQQRLTTIFILLSFLNGLLSNDEIELYSIDYQTRGPFGNFLKQLMIDLGPNNLELSVESHQIRFINEQFEVLIKKKQPLDRKKKHPWDNIDFYHILQTFVTIKNWFEAKDRCSHKSFRDILFERVKFIWYESADEDSIKVFTRLNIGKIKLTNAELIKALFLNRSNFITTDFDHLKLRQQEIASEWDHIENTLQNDEFWLFLQEKNYNRPTRIDFIFDMICERNSLKLDKKTISHIGSDDYKTFRYFYEYFRFEKHDIKDCWSKVKKYFQTFQEWYNDLELYHYVGYLINEEQNVSFLYSLWTESSSKAFFIASLKKKIIDLLKEKDCCDLSKQYEIDGGPAKTKCKRLLLLHNIQTVINQNKAFSSKEEYKLPVFYKFPFHLYKSEKWDVEHIDSNTTNGLENEKDQKEWLRYALLDEHLNDDLRKRIKVFLKNEEGKDSFKDLSTDIENQNNQDANWDDAVSDKNKIWNFVLLDAGTNRGYGNSIFPAKRRCIIGKDQGISFVIDDELNCQTKTGTIAFVPPVTKNVFLKYYNTSNANFRLWGKADAELYKENILITLEEFDVRDSSIINKTKDDNGQQ